MLSYLDYLVFLHAVFCTQQLYAFRSIIFSMFLRKQKLKITLFGVFARGFLRRTTRAKTPNSRDMRAF